MRYRDSPPEVRQLGRTMRKWRTQIAAWHQAQVPNGPTETMNVKIKSIRRDAPAFRNCAAQIRLHARQPRSVPTTTRITCDQFFRC